MMTKIDNDTCVTLLAIGGIIVFLWMKVIL